MLISSHRWRVYDFMPVVVQLKAVQSIGNIRDNE